MTRRLLRYSQEQALDQAFTRIADQIEVDEKTIRDVFSDYALELADTHNFATPFWLGLDEVYIDGAPCCVLTNLAAGTLFDILVDRKKSTVISYLLSLPKEDARRCGSSRWACGDRTVTQYAAPYLMPLSSLTSFMCSARRTMRWRASADGYVLA